MNFWTFPAISRKSKSERLEHVIILRERIAFIIKHPHTSTPHPLLTLPEIHPFLSIHLYSIPSFSIIPISITLYRYTNTNISSYSHMHLYTYIYIPISLFIFHFSNFPSSFHPYLPCISCIIKLYKICITEYFSWEYKHTTSYKNRLKRFLEPHRSNTTIHRHYIQFCLSTKYIIHHFVYIHSIMSCISYILTRF